MDLYVIDFQTGEELFDFVIEDLKLLKKAMCNSQGMAAIYVGVYVLNWINRKMKKWLGEKNTADSLSKSMANNVTSEMGLALLDVADVVRQYPAVMEYFKHTDNDTFFEDLRGLEGGNVVSKSMRMYLEKYGMRCSGEIDITRTRFSEQPTALIPMIFSNIKNFEQDAHNTRLKQGLLEVRQKKQDLLKRLKQLPGGRQKAKKTERMIDRLRNFTSYLEYLKYIMVEHYWIIKQALMEEGDILVTAFTDPSWTPIFISIKGLVTEVGGMMTHGSVVAGEYGLPAVVGVENATRIIKDGQRIRVNGTEGYVEIL